VEQEGFKEPESTTRYNTTQKKMLKGTRSKDKAALYMLYRVVDESIFEKIASATFEESVGHLGKSVRGC